jgi:disulfide bond formation protein DsbB
MVNAGKTPPTDPLTPRERRAMWVVGAICAVAIAVGAAVWAMAANSSNSTRSGEICVTVTMASSMGGGVEHACGAAARDWCRAAYVQHDTHAEAVQAQCRVAGILPQTTTPVT